MKKGFFWVFLLIANFISAQNKEVIFTIDKKPVYTDEFLRIYNKNIDLVQDESQKDIDEYLQLYIDYKLKVLQAEELKLDEKSSFLKEFDGYKKQLAKNYLTDTNASDVLIKEAYNRLKKEIKAKHILVIVDENASPQDTLKAWEQITKLRKEALLEGFDITMNKVHNGRTVYGEDLGYFSVFRMVYPFETVAYNTPVNGISQPVRTRFGYHIIKVEDVRDTRGEVEVEHIMIASSDKDPEDKQKQAKQRIDQLYRQVKGGVKFEDVARENSDDTGSARNGGLLGRIGTGQISSEAFENAAYALQNPGDVSEPVKTEFGWHIIKLLNKYPIGTFEEEKRALELKLKDDSRSKYITKAFVDKLKEEYGFKENKESREYLETAINEDVKNKGWSFDKTAPEIKKVLFVINNDKKLTIEDFLNWLEFRQRRMNIVDAKVFGEESYNQYVQQQLVGYREENLVNENAEYANIVKEYRDGLLLFDLMQYQIWDKAKNDTLGLESYYENHKKEYNWKGRADLVIGVCHDKSIAENVRKLLLKGSDIETIKKDFNSEEHISVVFTSATLEADDKQLPQQYILKEGVSEVYETKPNEYTIVKANNLQEPSAKTLQEAKGRVIGDYQQFLEQQWLQDLRKGHTIEVNKKVLNKIKKDIK